MPDYTVKDRESGQTITFRWNAPTPPNEADLAEVFKAARQQQPGGSLMGMSAAESFFGSHRPITEGGDPLESLGRVDAFLQQHLNPALREVAQPDSLSDVAGLAIPSMGGQSLRVPLGNMLREIVAGTKQAPSWRGVPGEVMGRLSKWATTPDDAIQAQRAARAPRLAGKAPTLNEALIEGLEAARKGAAPTSASLPGGDAIRTGPRYQDYRNATPKLGPLAQRPGAYSSEVTASAARPAAASGAPPAAAPPSPARSSPPPPAQTGMRLTAEESQALQELVRQGYDETEVLQAIAKQRPGGRPSSAAPPALSAAEAKEYQRLLGRGMSPGEAKTLIDQQRAYTQGQGLPTSEQAQRSVVDRNTSGRWD